MGWFDDQIEYRKKHERELLSDSFEEIARAVTGRRTGARLRDDADISDAISGMMSYFGIKEKEIPATAKGLRDRVDFLISGTGVLYREVILKRGWHADAMGMMIGSRKDGTVIALIPSARGGYEYLDPQSGEKKHVSAAEEKNIGEEALCFYRPMPMRKLKVRDLMRYMAECLTTWDLAGFGAAALAITLVGMVMPKLNQLLTGKVIQEGNSRLLAAVVGFMLFATMGRLVIGIIRELLLSRIRIKMDISVGAATMMRILNLETGFFKKYSAGELNQYITYMESLCDTIVDSVFSTAVTGLFSLVYLTQIFRFAPSLVWPSLIVTVATLAVTVLSASVQMRIDKEKMVHTAKERGLVFSLITGIQKIRLSGAENRAFTKWSGLYTKSAELEYNPPSIVKMSEVITTGIGLVGTAVMDWISIKTQVRVEDYFAFNSAYAYISSAFTSLASVALSAASIRPVIQIIRPLLEAEPETAEGRETVSRLSGSIEMSHVTFGYDPDSKPIFEDFSLSIPARQYVAIVGKSGCGKSTLVRLLLGFEQPQRGVINYDRKDLQRLDARSVRRQIGTVMQDGKLFSGSIFDNIVISAPTLELKDAWEAAEIAGIADDIRDMPMGMNTILQEGGGTISGGQRQRLMIARAIAPKPRILIFDEATSALDNITQKKVSEALDRMKCTRNIIAHRLSTIKHCDRTYDELIAKNGLFAELVARQRVDTDE